MLYTSASRARAIRRSTPIHFYCGPNGGGKSMCAVYDTLPTLEAGRPVLSTVRLLGPDGNDHPLYVPFRDWTQLLDWSFGDVILDEVVGVASSRQSQSLPAAPLLKMQQLRRGDVMLRATAPAFARCDVALRECVQAVTYCRGYLGQYVPGRLWRSKRVFRWSTYDAEQFEDFTVGKRQSLKPLARQWVRRDGGAAEAKRTYDTFDAVLSLGRANEFGICVVCDGSRRRHKCECSHEAADQATSTAERPQRSEDAVPGSSLAAVEVEDEPGTVLILPAQVTRSDDGESMGQTA